MGLSSDVTDGRTDDVQLKSDNEEQVQSGPMGLRPDIQLNYVEISKYSLNPVGPSQSNGFLSQGRAR